MVNILNTKGKVMKINKIIKGLFKVILGTIYIQNVNKIQLYQLELKLVFRLNVTTNKLQGIISCSINNSKRKQKKTKQNIITLSRTSRRYNQLGKKVLLERPTQ